MTAKNSQARVVRASWSSNTSEVNMRTNALICTILILTSVGVLSASAKWARLQDGTVMETFKNRPSFHPDIMASVVECPDSVEPQWRKDGDAWLPPKSAQEKDRDAFNTLRRSLLSMQGIHARKLMADRLAYRLNGPLATGYPDPATPMLTNAVGQALTVTQFADYMQECDDAGATQQEMQALRQQAKAARLYLKSLKGD